MPFLGNSASIRGGSHIASGKVCQDSSTVKIDEHYAIAVVSDGHGGDRYYRSHIGSRLAVECSIDVLGKYLSDVEFEHALISEPERTLTKVSNSILTIWRSSVEQYDAENPDT